MADLDQAANDIPDAPSSNRAAYVLSMVPCQLLPNGIDRITFCGEDRDGSCRRLDVWVRVLRCLDSLTHRTMHLSKVVLCCEVPFFAVVQHARESD